MKSKWTRFIRFVRYCFRLDPMLIFFGMTASISQAIKPFIALILSKMLLEAILIRGDYMTLLRNTLLLLTLHFIFAVVGGFAEKRYDYHIQTFRRKHEMKKACHLLEINYEWTEDDKTQELITELLNLETKNVYGYRSFLQHVNKSVASLISVVVAIYLLSGIFFTGASIGTLPEWSVDLGFVVVFVAMFSLTLKIVSWITQQYGKIIRSESVSSLRYLKAYNVLIYRYKSGQDIRLYHMDLVREYTKKYRETSSRAYKLFSNIFAKTGSLESLVANLSSCAIYVFVALKALYQGIQVSEILLYIGAFTQLTQQAMELVDSINMLSSGDLYREKILEYYAMGQDSNTINQNKPRIKSNTRSLSYAFNNVTFTYPGSEKPALKNVSFSIQSGEKLAIVGVNGSGKSTLIKLLVGLYRHYTGDIFLGNHHAADLDEDSSRDLFAVVFQDFKLLALTLKDNVTSFQDIADEEVQRVFEKVGMASFYDKHGPNAFLTKGFDGSGIEVSGGEAQKIAMARSIIKSGDIFILDEPTSALDPIAERDIYTKFNDITEGKTTIFISHRLSSCKFCDRILVVDGGEIVQTGTHEELLFDTEGKYYELWNAQAQHYRTASAAETQSYFI